MPPSHKVNLKDKIDDGEIDLSMCDLEDVPVKDIAKTKSVHSLDLSNNHLVTLSKSFASLNFLTKLDLSKNSLRELPENFGDLVKLRHLDLYKNQLQHLPLSFSKLKALKWLDLKDNPLVSAIQDIAGPCLDSKQCLTCARNIVQFYSEIQQKVEIERDMREKQRQKDLQANELAQQKQKRQEKKNKKKEKKQKMPEYISTNNYLIDEPMMEDILYDCSHSSASPKKKTKFFGAIFNLIHTLLKHVILFTLVVFLLTSLKLQLTQVLESKVVHQWGQLIETVPKPYHCYLNSFSTYFQIVHAKTGDSLHVVIYYARHFANMINIDNINYVYQRIVTFCYDLFKLKK